LHCEPAARHRTFFLELRDPGFDLFRRNRKSDADRAAGWGKYDRVDADDVAGKIEGRPPELPLLIGASI